MKLWIILSSLLICLPVQADFGSGFIVGSLLSSSPKTEVHKDEFTTQVEAMEERLPYSSSHYSETPEERFTVVPEDAPKYQAYFANKGFKAQIQGNELVIDLKSNHEALIRAKAESEARWQQQKPFWKKVGWILLIIWLGMALVQTGMMFVKNFNKESSLTYVFVKILSEYIARNRPKK